jgi:hypothetical protein
MDNERMIDDAQAGNGACARPALRAAQASRSARSDWRSERLVANTADGS